MGEGIDMKKELFVTQVEATSVSMVEAAEQGSGPCVESGPMMQEEVVAPEEEVVSAEMETTSTADAEGLLEKLRSAVEGYFTLANLRKDQFLLSNMNHQLVVPLVIVAQLANVACLTTDLNLIAEALKPSTAVTLMEDLQGVKPNIRMERTTIILREIPSSTPEERIRGIFAFDGCPPVKSIRPDLNDTWFVTMESEEAAKSVLLSLASRKFDDQPVRARLKSETPIKPLMTSVAPAAAVDVAGGMMFPGASKIPPAAAGGFPPYPAAGGRGPYVVGPQGFNTGFAPFPMAPMQMMYPRGGYGHNNGGHRGGRGGGMNGRNGGSFNGGQAMQQQQGRGGGNFQQSQGAYNAGAGSGAVAQQQQQQQQQTSGKAGDNKVTVDAEAPALSSSSSSMAGGLPPAGQQQQQPASQPQQQPQQQQQQQQQPGAPGTGKKGKKKKAKEQRDEAARLAAQALTAGQQQQSAAPLQVPSQQQQQAKEVQSAVSGEDKQQQQAAAEAHSPVAAVSSANKPQHRNGGMRPDAGRRKGPGGMQSSFNGQHEAGKGEGREGEAEKAKNKQQQQLEEVDLSMSQTNFPPLSGAQEASPAKSPSPRPMMWGEEMKWAQALLRDSARSQPMRLELPSRDDAESNGLDASTSSNSKPAAAMEPSHMPQTPAGNQELQTPSLGSVDSDASTPGTPGEPATSSSSSVCLVTQCLDQPSPQTEARPPASPAGDMMEWGASTVQGGAVQQGSGETAEGSEEAAATQKTSIVPDCETTPAASRHDDEEASSSSTAAAVSCDAAAASTAAKRTFSSWAAAVKSSSSAAPTARPPVAAASKSLSTAAGSAAQPTVSKGPTAMDVKEAAAVAPSSLEKSSSVCKRKEQVSSPGRGGEEGVSCGQAQGSGKEMQVEAQEQQHDPVVVKQPEETAAMKKAVLVEEPVASSSTAATSCTTVAPVKQQATTTTTVQATEVLPAEEEGSQQQQQQQGAQKKVAVSGAWGNRRTFAEILAQGPSKTSSA